MPDMKNPAEKPIYRDGVPYTKDERGLYRAPDGGLLACGKPIYRGGGMKVPCFKTYGHPGPCE